MNREQAIDHAYQRSRKDGKVRYVVYDCGEYHVCREHELDTYFGGCDDPVYCTADDQPDIY